MNQDDFDIFRHLKRDQKSSQGLELLRGVEDRQFGHFLKNVKAKENVALYAEEELVRKNKYKEMRCEMPGLPRSTFLMVFSADGSKVASTHGNHNIYVTDIRTGKNIKTLNGHPRTPWCIAFHPTSNQIVASGCLGGQVRIWDLSGGSEVWTAGSKSVIASIAFHPNDRVLVIATYNEVYFWDWSKPEPFVHAATSNPKEKVRYVAFDKLGHKLITGIANSPQTRWERVRAPVPVPRQAERCASPYRRRITPRLVNMQSQEPPPVESPIRDREPHSTGPERERRITMCYRNLVREYDQLVQRYLQLYRPPTMIDRGTDPMEPNPSSTSSCTQTSEPSTSGTSSSAPQASNDTPSTSTRIDAPSQSQPQPSTSSLITPSCIFPKKLNRLIQGTQTSESLKHKLDDGTEVAQQQEKRPKTDTTIEENQSSSSSSSSELPCPGTSSTPDANPNVSQTDIGIQTPTPRRILVIPYARRPHDRQPSPDVRTRYESMGYSCPPESANPGPSSSQSNVDELLSNIRRTAEEEVRQRILPIIRSVPANDRPELIRLFENSRENIRSRLRQCGPLIVNPKFGPNVNNNVSSDDGSDDEPVPSTSASDISNTSARTMPHVSNFNTQLERLVSSLLTEIERNETERTSVGATASTSTTQTTTTTSTISTNTVETGTATSLPSTSSEAPTNALLFTEILENLERLQNRTRELTNSRSNTPETPSTIANTSTRTTNSTIYTSNSLPRRRFFSHRVSAFMPTRVNYTRSPTRFGRNTHMWGRSRLGSRFSGNHTFALDELINYSERANSEDDPPQSEPFDTIPEFASMNAENIGIGNMYSNIVQDLESSLNDVRNIRASSRFGDTSDMLSSFSERLENIMNQSDTILRNLRSSMEMLSTTAEQSTGAASGSGRGQTSSSSTGSNEPSWTFFDSNFYVRDQRTENAEGSSSSDLGGGGFSDYFRPFRNYSAVAADHTYPRNPDQPPAGSSSPENMSPLMTSLHLTISHIQRQARLLRQQVESIERIDRAMIEVAQLQLIRQLIIELIRHIRNVSGERSAGMSSVRQMMAGTRISDSSPYDSPAEEANAVPSVSQPLRPSTSSEATPSTSEGPSGSQTARQRGSSRKTYPPSRFFRLRRRPSMIHFLSRRYLNRHERSHRPQSARASQRMAQDIRNLTITNFSGINSTTMSVMTMCLERLLTEHMRPFTRPQESATPPSYSAPAIDLGEHILALRLHGCVLRMNTVLGLNTNGDTNTFRNLRADPTAAVTPDGVSRISARHSLTLLIDGLSRHMEELGGTQFSQSLRLQIHGVLAMSLLLCELLLLQVVDSIPPPSGMNLDPERESLTLRIDQMCGQMLQCRQSHQLTRSLRLMRLTMRHAYRALDQTYNARRNAMLPRPDTDRRQLLGSINRCLRTINRRRSHVSPEASTSAPTPSTSTAAPSASATSEPSEANMNELYSTLSDLITRYSDDPDQANPSTSNNNTSSNDSNNQRIDNNNSSNNSDDNDEETEWQNSQRRNRNIYRSNNVNLVHNNGSVSQGRLWNVPSVQINDVPIPEESLFAQRLQNQRQRFAERVSNLSSMPTFSLFRPRFLHPLYASVNPFDQDLDDPQREQIYDSDVITTVTPNHRIQAWDISNWSVPAISNSLKNVVVGECKIHNDASVDVARDGTILVTLLPSGGYLNVTNRLGVYSLKWETLGQCLYTTNFEQNAVSVSLSPLSRHLVVGLASRRVSIVQTDRWIMARIFKIEQKEEPGDRLPVLRELEQNRDSRINCIRWLPTSGQGLIYATNTGQLVVLT